jgi:hypothetical protein
MPNVCWNVVAIEGAEEDVQRFVERVVSKELDRSGKPYVLDFEAHVPIPPAVGDVREWLMYAWGSKQPMAPELLERSPGRAVYSITTPVTVPIPWLEKTAALEPELTFEHEYLFEFDDMGHRMRHEGGELVTEEEVYMTDFDWVTLVED